MSTPDRRLGELRQAASPALSPAEFDTVLEEVRTYHAQHPPGELVEQVPSTKMGNRKAQHTMMANHQETLNALQTEHRETLVTMLQQRDVPRALATTIVDELVLGD